MTGLLRRSEVAATVVVLALAAIGVYALWPQANGREHLVPGEGSARAVSAAPADAELAPMRAQAQLAPCPEPEPTSPRAQGPLAAVTVPCLGAPGSVRLGAALAGKTALLNLWASWCEPCRAELPALAGYAARPGAVPVLEVAVQDAPRASLALLTDLGVRLPSVGDPDGALRAAIHAPPTLPVSYLVRPDGSVTRMDPPVPLRSADEVATAVARYTGGSG